MSVARELRWRGARRALRWARDVAYGRLWRLADTSRPRHVEPPVRWHLLAEYATPVRQRPELGADNANRLHNMRLASTLIHGLELLPNEIFSLARLVGEPSAERGFRTGPVIANDALVSAVGGGLCQVATTLYGAALAANLRILEKHGHSRDIWGEARLVELGRDAAYVYLRKDLVFASTRAAPLVVHLELSESALRCRLFSPAPLEGEVSLRFEILERLAAPPGGRPGWVVRTTRRCRGERLSYERTDRYEPHRT